MSKKRQARNSRKFKKAAASKRARMPKQQGGFVDEREMEMREPRRAPRRALAVEQPIREEEVKTPVEAPSGRVMPTKMPVDTKGPISNVVMSDGAPAPGATMPDGFTSSERSGQLVIRPNVAVSAPAGRIMPTKMPADTKGPISSVMMSDGVSAPGGIMSDGFVPPEMSGRVMPTRRPSPAEQQRNAEIARIQQEEMARIQEAIARGEVPIPELSELQGQQQRSNQVSTNQSSPANAGEARSRQQAAQSTGAPDPANYEGGAEDPAYLQDLGEYFRENPIDINLPDFRGYNPFNPGGTRNVRGPRRDGSGSSIPGTGFGLPEGAPIDLEIERPELPDVPQIETQDVEVGDPSTVYSMSDTGDAQLTEGVATMAQAAGPAAVATADAPREVDASTMEAALAEGVAPGEARTGELSPEAIAQFEAGQITQPAVAATRDSAQEAAARAVAAQRPEQREYAQGITSDERYQVIQAEDPEVATRIAQTISDRAKQDLLDIVTGEGVNLDDIPEFKLAERRTAQVAEAQRGIAQDLGNAPSVDLEGRQAITGEAPKGDAAQIGGIPTLAAASRQAVTGSERRTAAADMNAVVGNLPPKITEAVLDDPETVEAQMDTQPVEVKAAVAALPKEALVSTQMEGLLAGLEDGEIPAWARPAVAAINSQMASRGLSTSTVGRDALFNAIIQSALPIAQSNAQALQQRAAQNLSNEQQANLQQASQVMQQRMANLANRQTAASQTAAMAQEINVRQAEFEQQATLTTAQQEQQTRMQNLQNAQQQASQESAQRQQAALANLDAATRMDLANLDALNMASRDNLNAEQQTRLTEYNAKVNRVMRQAELEQDMEKANLSAELQVELKNLTEMNAASRDTMTAENQERLTNLNVLVDFKKTNASLAQQMDLANMNMAQQVELANLAERAAADSANFTAANQFRLQELTTTVNVLSQNAELRQRAELAQLSAAEKVELANLTAKNQADSENMNAENIASLQVFEKRMQAGVVNAQLAQQMGLANLSNQQQAAMFNAQIDANLDMAQFNADQQAAMANSQFMQSMTMKDFDARQQSIMQNATALASMDMANLDARTKIAAQNAQAFLQMDMANLSNEQQMAVLNQQQAQQTLLSNQAVENAARQFNAANQQQADQFMASLASQTSQFNASQTNAMAQFNISEQNRISAQNAQNSTQVSLANAQMATELSRFNAQMDAQREQFNVANRQAIEQADIAWRRQANTINTAAANAANQQNVMNSFNLSMAELQYLWQEARDNAAYTRQAYENDQTRQTQLYATAIGNEAAASGEKNSTTTSTIMRLIEQYINK